MQRVRGVIRRRILANYRVDPEVAQRQLPPPFRPKLHRGYAVGGVCLIRLEQVRPAALPLAVGVCSENAAHRFAVEWTDEAGGTREGVYIPRRDTGSALNQLVSGRLFPGEYHGARFWVRDDGDAIDLAMRSDDGVVAVRLQARAAAALPSTSRFASLAEASAFFAGGAIGYSPAANGARLDGMRLETEQWQVAPLAVEEIESSYFADPVRFPSGSVAFDCALLMRNIPHEWHTAPDLHSIACDTVGSACMA